MNHRSKPYLLLIGCILAYVCGGATSMLMAVFLPNVISDLLGNNNQEIVSQAGPWLNAAFLAGMTLGGPVIGLFSDRFGRLSMLIASLFCCGLATLWSRWLDNWVVLALFRAVAGIGVSGILLVCAVLLSEQWEEKSVAVAQGILGVAFPIGIVLAGGLNVLFSNWRDAFGAIGVSTLALSVTTLASAFKLQSAERSMQSDKAVPGISSLFGQEHRRKLFEGILVYGFDLVGLWAIFSWMPTWVDSMLDEHTEAGQMRGATMILLGMGGMVGTGISGYLVNRFGLRRVLLSNFLGTFCICLFVFTTNHTFSDMILVETTVLSLFFGVSQGALTVYVTELFPSEIRATGTGFCFNIGRIFTTSAVFFVGALVMVMGGYSKAMLAFSFAFLLAFLILYLGRNYKGPILKIKD